PFVGGPHGCTRYLARSEVHGQISSDRRQLLLPVALPQLFCYRAPVVASRNLLPGGTEEGRQRWRTQSAERCDESAYALSVNGTGRARAWRSGGSSTSSSR